MDKDVLGAQSAVARWIDLKRNELGLELLSGYAPCQHLNGESPHGTTRHELADGRKLTLYHLLMPVRRSFS
jgi:hypothetical protein